MHPTLTTFLFASSVFAAVAPTKGEAPTNVTGALGNAIKYENNPKGEVYTAQFSEKLSGSITFSTSSDGKSITVKLDLSNLPSQTGNYSYHIHDQPVPPNENCTLTLAHLDPFIRGHAIPCDPKRPESCEVGDLSGKHGGIPSTNRKNHTQLSLITFDNILCFQLHTLRHIPTITSHWSRVWALILEIALLLFTIQTPIALPVQTSRS